MVGVNLRDAFVLVESDILGFLICAIFCIRLQDLFGHLTLMLCSLAAPTVPWAALGLQGAGLGLAAQPSGAPPTGQSDSTVAICGSDKP